MVEDYRRADALKDGMHELRREAASIADELSVVMERLGVSRAGHAGGAAVGQGVARIDATEVVMRQLAKVFRQHSRAALHDALTANTGNVERAIASLVGQAERLPPGWAAHLHEGRTFYHRAASGKSQWELPSALPPAPPPAPPSVPPPVSASIQPSGAGSGRSTMEHDDLRVRLVAYLPMKDLVSGFTLTKTVSQYLLEDAMPVLSTALQQLMPELVRHCSLSTQSRLPSGDLLNKYPGMMPQYALAINIWSMDCRRIADVERKVNFFVEFCDLLWLRSNEINTRLCGFSFFLFRGLSLLPDWAGVGHCGVDGEGVSKFNVKNVYAHGSCTGRP